MNRLASERSAYLKHSAHQKIDWYPWSEEAFERADKEDKPVFLSTGAVWCHWCHVMAKECFENSEIVKILNDDFICVKLDRDERPDIDRRYQQAVAAMGSGGGWPLSVFLTSEKKPFFGGTYFPPDDMTGRPGFKKILRAVADFYKSKKEDVNEYSEKLLNSLRHRPMQETETKKSLLDDAVESIISEADLENGGFGSAPKFHMPGAAGFLTGRYFFTGDETLKTILEKAFRAMASGGFHDHLGGGFHRYSTDRAWLIPHFEKMADDNAWLLRNYVDAYSVFYDGYFREVAEGMAGFVRDVLSDPEGGFYASMDADVTPDDEGGYFTWTEEDFRQVLSPEEYEALSLRFLDERGTMHHDRSKKVLFAAVGTKEIAEKTGKDEGTVAGLIKSGIKKLLSARLKRETPFIDKALYTSLNGMMIASYLRAYKILGDKYLKEFALKSLDRIMTIRFINGELLHSEGVSAVLDDYIYLVEALVEAYEITGQASYINSADEFMDTCINKLWDKDEGGFFDTDKHILEIKLKGIEDIPHPSPNSLAILVLLKLHAATGKDIYRQYAESGLKVFSGKAKDLGIHAGSYFCALDAYFNMLKITIEAPPESELAKAISLSAYPYKTAVYGEDKGRIIPCLGNVCYEPIYSPDNALNFLKGLIDTNLKHDSI